MLVNNELARTINQLGNPYDNVKAESFMKTLTVRAVYPTAYETFSDVALKILSFIGEVHNTRR